jgi:hypothetical protein
MRREDGFLEVFADKPVRVMLYDLAADETGRLIDRSIELAKLEMTDEWWDVYRRGHKCISADPPLPFARRILADGFSRLTQWGRRPCQTTRPADPHQERIIDDPLGP